MHRGIQVLISTSVLMLIGCKPNPPVVISIDRPTVIGFFPPTTQEELDDDTGGLNEALAHIGFALDDISKCMEPREVTTRFELTESLTIQDGKAAHRFRFPQNQVEDFGIIIVAPGRTPIVVNTGADPSSLVPLAQAAARKYFSEPKCKSLEE